MTKIFGFAFLMVLVSACSPSVTTDDLQFLNGYWEIEKVVSKDGTEKTYDMNTTYDYFEFKGNSGKRIKVMPQLDGSFATNAIAEKIEIDQKENQVFLNYKTNFATWSEELRELSANRMILVNEQKTEYHYKKTEAINLDYGKEAK